MTVGPARVEGRLGAWGPRGQGWRVPEVGPLPSLKEGPRGQGTVSRGEGPPGRTGAQAWP